MIREFQKFIMRGNVLDLAVGIIIGAAFSGIVNSLVNDIILPPIGFLLGGVDFSNLYINLSGGEYESLTAAKEAGAATINYGVFLNVLLNFVIVAVVIFVLIRGFNRMVRPITRRIEKPGEPVNKECPYCITSIPYRATRCPNCTSPLQVPQ